MEKQDNQTLENKNLILAIKDAELENMKKALENGADIEVLDEKGNTPLIQALDYVGELPIDEEDFNIISFLIKSGANVNPINDISPLTFLCMLCEIKLVKLLIQKGADVNVVDNNGHTPLIVVIISHLVYHQIKTEIFISDEKKYQENVETNQKNIIELLIKNGADINIKVKNLSILDYACMFSDIEIIEILIKNGADVNSKDNNMSLLAYILLMSKESLILVTYDKEIDFDKAFLNFDKNRLKIAQLLIDNGAKIDKSLWTLSFMNKVIFDKKFNLIESIEEKEAEKSLVNSFNFGDIRIVKFLLDNGMDINMPIDDKGTIPLIVSCCFKELYDYDMCSFLIKNGANVNFKDNQGMSILNHFSIGVAKHIDKKILKLIFDKIDEKIYNEHFEINLYRKSAEIFNKIDYLEKENLKKNPKKKILNFKTPMTDILKSKDTQGLKDLIASGYDISSIHIIEFIKKEYPLAFIEEILKHTHSVNTPDIKGLFHPKSQDNLKINLISFKIHNLMLRFQLNFYNYHC